MSPPRSSEPQSNFKLLTNSVLSASESAAGAVRRWNDPREQLLRRRRRARRQASRFGSASAVSAVGTAALAAGSVSEWIVVLGGSATAALLLPAALGLRRFSRLKRTRLPLAARPQIVLPDRRSAAFESMARLRGNEIALRQILTVLNRSEFVSSDMVDSADSVARSAVAALDAVSADVVSMERACVNSPAAAHHLRPSIAVAAKQLGAGVDEYEHLVETAAQLTMSAHSAAVSELNFRRAELQAAADRLHGWASGIAEVGDITGRYT